MANETVNPGKAVVNDVRFSFVHVFEPASYENSPDKKYSTQVLVSKDNKDAVKILRAAEEACVAAAKIRNGGKLPVPFKMPIRDGDLERPDAPEYKNCWFFNANHKTKPGILDAQNRPIADQDLFYSGVYGNISVTFFVFPKGGCKGIAVGLNNVKKTRDGDPLSGRASANQDFGAAVDSDNDML